MITEEKGTVTFHIVMMHDSFLKYVHLECINELMEKPLIFALQMMINIIYTTITFS